jgi:hypothetical protein
MVADHIDGDFQFQLESQSNRYIGKTLNIEDANAIQFSDTHKIRKIDSNGVHVVFLGANGEIAFSARESNLHIGCEVIATFPNYKEASDFCKNYRKEKKTSG